MYTKSDLCKAWTQIVLIHRHHCYEIGSKPRNAIEEMKSVLGEDLVKATFVGIVRLMDANPDAPDYNWQMAWRDGRISSRYYEICRGLESPVELGGTVYGLSHDEMHSTHIDQYLDHILR